MAKDINNAEVLAQTEDVELRDHESVNSILRENRIRADTSQSNSGYLTSFAIEEVTKGQGRSQLFDKLRLTFISTYPQNCTRN